MNLHVRRKHSNIGFTILELLAAIAIMVVLAGIGIPAYNSWKGRARIEKAKATIAQIEVALEMYKTDNGAYPSNAENLNNGTIMNANVLGNYLNIKLEDLDLQNNILDPWRNAYVVYVDHDGDPQTGPGNNNDFRLNRGAYYIYSCGPNGDPADADDIDNYGV